MQVAWLQMMSTQPICKTMRELTDIQADDSQDNLILERIKKLAADYLPEGWQEWEIVIWDKDRLLGDELDPQILNKLRFALTTIGLAQSFDPEISNLPERVYRNFKVKILNWLLLHRIDCTSARRIWDMDYVEEETESEVASTRKEFITEFFTRRSRFRFYPSDSRTGACYSTP